MNFDLSVGPHIRARDDTSSLMRWMIIALLFPAGTAIYYFGWSALLLMVFTTLTSILTEALFLRLAKKPPATDNSSVVAGLLLSLILPPTTPLWLAAIGAIFAMVVVKGLFGGLGFNIFNPALAARAFLLASWPVAMTTWVKPFETVTTATPLYLVKIHEVGPPYLDLFLGNRAGSLGETSILAILIGALILYWRKVIDWPAPTAFIGSVSILTLLLGHDPIYYVMSGGLLFGAFFMATDYVTTPVTTAGRFVFGLGCGAITVLIRFYGGFPEGVNYAILLMNITAPIIDKSVRPRVYGVGRK